MPGTRLSQFFVGAAAKRLSVVETDPSVSNQHEIDGINSFKKILGHDKQKFEAVYIHLTAEEEPLIDQSSVTWYDSRENHPTRTEYRLYYTVNSVTDAFSADDILLVARTVDDRLFVIVAESASSVVTQLLWLFRLPMPDSGSNVIEIENENDRSISFLESMLLRLLGIDAVESVDERLEEMLQAFNCTFPTTKVFSDYARSTLTEIDCTANPDDALVAWLEQEERLFKTLEKYVVDERLREGFVVSGDVDVEGFIQFSLSVHNRRKSRAGLGFENHVEHILSSFGVRYTRNGRTEGKTKPDFLFPGEQEYTNPEYETAMLAMLGAKASCKDRWRQVLAEADRIPVKHLVTVEPCISVAQTDEMRNKGLQLVVPPIVGATYSEAQQQWLTSFQTFIQMIQQMQKA